MFGSGSPWGFLFEHPVIGLAVFVAVTAGVIVVLSGGKLGEQLSGMLRVFVSIFTTPFVFLRDALAIIRTSNESEQDYARSRVYMLFRLNRIQYLGLVILCLLTLSSGVTSSLLSLYPSQEIEQGRQLSQQVNDLQRQLVEANQAVTAAGAPGFRENLRAQRDQAQAAYRQQAQSTAEFAQSTKFSGDLITQLSNTSNTGYIENVRNGIDGYMQSCPRGYYWQGMSAADCGQFRTFVLELADRKTHEIALAQAADEANTAWQQADSAAQVATQNQQNIQAQLDATKQARDHVSLFNPSVMGERIKSAIGGLIATLLSVIALVWLGAIFIDVLNWIILMMRAGERASTERLERARTEPTS